MTCETSTHCRQCSNQDNPCNITMYRIGCTWFESRRLVHTWSCEGPSDTLRKQITQMVKNKKKIKNPKRDEFIVEVKESNDYLDTLKMPMVLTFVVVALFAKVLMMYDESKSQETIERKIKNAPAGQGTVRMLNREQWEEIQEVRPRTPFESKLARSNARLRIAESMHMEDMKDWTVDVIMDAFTRIEESVRRHSR